MPASSPFSADDGLAALLARCRRHEPAAQQALYERFAGPMLLVARRYTPALADAEDILQDAFIKVFQKLPEQREEHAFAGWVRRIVISTAINEWHRRRVRRTDFLLDEVHHVPAPDASVVDRLTVAEVRALIDQLPAGCRLVILLYTIEGYSHAEIGQMLGIGASGSKAQLTRARQRLTVLVRDRERTRGPDPSPATTVSLPPDNGLAPFHPLTALLFQ